MIQNKYMRARVFRATLVVFFAVTSLFIISAAVIGAGKMASVAPLNPSYIEQMAKRQAASLTGEPLFKPGFNGRGKGLIPSRINHSFKQRHRADRAKVHAAMQGALNQSGYPSYYNLVQKGWVSPVKDQSNCGSCWAHAAIASIESYIMPTKTDFSEQFIIDTHGFDWGPCDGGTNEMAIAVFARQGAIAINQYTYHYLDATASSPAMPPSAISAAHIQQAEWLQTGLLNGQPYNDDLKWALTSFGVACAIGVNFDNNYYNSDTASLYVPINEGTDHAVAVVGWDDKYAASNFNPQPPGPGAWIVKNSWGTDFGNNGYFYLSYWDASVGPEGYAYNDNESATNYNWAYQYDPLGWLDNIGFGTDQDGTSTAWMANVFRANAQGSHIKAVSFYLYEWNTYYDVYIYDKVVTGGELYNPSVDPVIGNLVYHQSGYFSEDAGYVTVVLNKAVHVTPGYNFSVVVKLKDDYGYQWPLAMQDQVAPPDGNSSRSYAIPGQSFISADGSQGSWQDLFTWSPPAKVCLKAFAAK